MITKVAKRKKEISSFIKLAQYITNQKTLSDGTNKIAAIRFTNCHALDLNDAIREIIATQAQNQTTKSNKTYHLIVSFPLGERPDANTLHDIEEALVAAVGLEAHQRLSAVHLDTSYLHIHIAVNKIQPQTLRIADLKHDYRRLQQASRSLEQKHGLQRLNVAAELATEQQINDLRDALDLAIRKPNPQWAEIHDLLVERHLQIKPAGRGLHIINSRAGIKASQLGRAFSRTNLEKRLGVYESDSKDAQRLSSEAEAINRSAKIESFQIWAKETLADPLSVVLADNSAQWHDIHTLLAKHGLRIKPAGRGLVITDNLGKAAIKPSQISRAFSRAHLEEKLGAYKPADADIVVKSCPYHRQGAQKQAGSKALWEEYTQLRDTAKKTRKEEYAEYIKERDIQAGHVKTDFANARTAIWSDKLLSSAVKRRLAKELSLKRKARLAKLAADNAALRDQINGRTSVPPWRDFLLEKAQAGDALAIKALRNSKPQAIHSETANKHDDNPSGRQQHRAKLIADFETLRETIWSDTLLSRKQKYRLNKYINKRQTKVLAAISGIGWNAYLKKRAGQGDTSAQTVLKQQDDLSNTTTDTVDIAAGLLSAKTNNWQVKPNGDVALGEAVIIRNNRIHILAAAGHNIALGIATRFWGWRHESKSQRDVEL